MQHMQNQNIISSNKNKSNDINNTSSRSSKLGLMPLVLAFIVGVALIPWKLGHAATANPIKWHPGHYSILVGDPNNSNLMNEVYNELTETPALRGVVIRYDWSELEKSPGVYTFQSIDARLKELTARKKRLIVLLEVKSFDKSKIVPSYLLTTQYDGGVFPIGKFGSNAVNGYNIKLWNNAVKERLTALITAIGKRYDGNPNFEGFGMQETALGDPVKAVTNAQVDGYYKNLVAVNKHMRTQFPHTMVFQYTNYPRPVIKSVIDNLKATGGTLAATDIFLDDPGLNYKGTPPGVFTYFPKNAGAMPLAAQVEKSNYLDTRHDGNGYKPTVTQLLNFARDNLHVNYLFWTRTPEIFPKVLEVLRGKAQKVTPSGGLPAGCPKSYESCKN